MLLDLAPYQRALARHLPPSASVLRLADASGEIGPALAELRADLIVQAVAGAPGLAALPASSVDAVTWLGPLDAPLLTAAEHALRAGGRFIAVDPAGHPEPAQVTALKAAGLVRVLVETAEPTCEPAGVLMRGERPHTTADTLARVESVAARDAAATDWATFPGRYVHLLVTVTPNKPVWKLAPGEQVTWQAAAVATPDGPTLLAFSSLPNAVAFLQQAVLAGVMDGVNKVAKFPRAAAGRWATPLLFNPVLSALAGRTLVRVLVDPTNAVTGEE